MGAGGSMNGRPMGGAGMGNTPPMKGGGYGMDMGAGMGAGSPYKQSDMMSGYSPLGTAPTQMQSAGAIPSQLQPFGQMQSAGAIPSQLQPFGQMQTYKAQMPQLGQMSGMIHNGAGLGGGLGGLYQQAPMQGLGAYMPTAPMPPQSGMQGGLGAIAPSLPNAATRSA